MTLKGHVLIEGHIACVTGLHIGAATDSIEIGGIDSPVIRHPVSRDPYIPGSSLKGKMRSLLELRDKWNDLSRSGGEDVFRHECPNTEAAKNCVVCRPFGSTASGNENKGKNHPALLIVRDGKLLNRAKLVREELLMTEAKMENTLDRMTAHAMPRTIERVPASAEFELSMVYRCMEDANMRTDLKNVLSMLQLIEREGLGGHVSRGYGQVMFFINRLQGVKLDGTDAGGLGKEAKGKRPAECIAFVEKIKFG